jgi:hypothetical protein
MADLVVLYESAIGYALFDVKETEDIGIEADSVQVSMPAMLNSAAIMCLARFSALTSCSSAGCCPRPCQVWQDLQAQGHHALPLCSRCS